jgi:hypothetical protein
MKRAHIAFFALGILTGCAGLIGVPDLTFDEQASQGSPDGSTAADGNVGGDGGPGPSTDSGIDSSTPCDETKLTTDAKHCGRCGHDCLGGACNAGKCESFVLKGALSNPVGLTTDATNVYVTTLGDGAVLRIPKDGSTASTIVTGHEKARGVTIGGNELFWSSADFAGDGGDGSWGGVWGCTLPACTNVHFVTEGDYASNVRYANGSLFFAEGNNSAIVRVQPDGSNRVALTTATGPFSVAVDATHVYYQANIPNLERVPVDGGAEESVGPLLPASGSLGLMDIDSDRVYWAFSQDESTGHVYSAMKSSPTATRIEYGTDNKNSVGVAVDATTVFWTNQGTFGAAPPFNNNGDGDVRACPKAGCGAAPIVLQQNLKAPGAIHVDGDAIYFLTFGTSGNTSDGELRRIAKP